MTNATTVQSVPTIQQLGAVPNGEGDHRFFLNHLATVKVGAGDAASQMSAVQFTARSALVLDPVVA